MVVLGVFCGGRMLEVGCGCGVALVQLEERCCQERLVGIDVDVALLELAVEWLLRYGVEVELVHADVRALLFKDKLLDVVVDFGMI